MTGLPVDTLDSRQRRRLVVEATLRTLGTVAVLVTLYYVLPLDRGLDVATVAAISLACAVLVVVMALQIRTITRSEHPGIRAAEALAFTIPVYLLSFATIYYLMARALSTNFTEPLTRTDALYFSVTVFATVGFGDISAKSDAARLVVTLQMLLNLLLLGLVVRLFLNAVKRGQQRQVEPLQE
jgi:hypothetical protein